MLSRMEQAHQPAMAHHVYRAAKMGAWVLNYGNWYNLSVVRSFVTAFRVELRNICAISVSFTAKSRLCSELRTRVLPYLMLRLQRNSQPPPVMDVSWEDSGYPKALAPDQSWTHAQPRPSIQHQGSAPRSASGGQSYSGRAPYRPA